MFPFSVHCRFVTFQLYSPKSKDRCFWVIKYLKWSIVPFENKRLKREEFIGSSNEWSIVEGCTLQCNRVIGRRITRSIEVHLNTIFSIVDVRTMINLVTTNYCIGTIWNGDVIVEDIWIQLPTNFIPMVITWRISIHFSGNCLKGRIFTFNKLVSVYISDVDHWPSNDNIVIESDGKWYKWHRPSNTLRWYDMLYPISPQFSPWEIGM